MKKKIILFVVVTLMIAGTVLPVLATPTSYGSSGENDSTASGTSAVNLDVAITTDWVNGWQDHGLRIRIERQEVESWVVKRSRNRFR